MTTRRCSNSAGTSPTNVTWSSTGAGGTALLDAATGLIQPALLGPGDYTYLLEYGYGTYLHTQDERVVHVDPLPMVTTSGTDLFCENDGTVVLASGAPAARGRATASPTASATLPRACP